MIRRVLQDFCTKTTNNDTTATQHVRKNSLKRQTIDSKHISTISSIIDKSELESKHIRRVETQKSNFGLYALKFNRNEAKRSASFNPSSSIERFQWSNEERQTSTIAPNAIKHEYFEPCQMNGQCETDRCYVEATDQDEYYRIEFGQTFEFDLTNTDRQQQQIMQNDEYCVITRSESEMATHRRKKKAAPIPPKRNKTVKRNLVKTTPTIQHNGIHLQSDPRKIVQRTIISEC